MLATGLRERGRALVVIEDQPDVAARAEADGFEVIRGNAAEERVLARAEIASAAKLLIAIPEGFEGGAVAERGRAMRPDLPIIARAHSDAEVAYLEQLGAGHVVMGERETAAKMLLLTMRGVKGPKEAPTTATA